MDQTFIFFMVLLFVAVVLGLEGLYQTWQAKNGAQAKRLAARLRGLDGKADDAPLSIERANRTGGLAWLDNKMLTAMPLGASLAKYVRTAGVGIGPTGLIIMTVALFAMGMLVPRLMAKPGIFSLLLGCVLAVLPWFWLARKRNQRIQIFERQIPDALDLMGRALRAGHAFPTTVKMVADEMPNPIAHEFRVLFDETNFGIPANDALMRMGDRVPVDDVRYFVIAVMIQRESGGNLAELLDNISAIVRARLKLLGEVRTLSAEGKMSAWVLGLLPFAMALVVNFINPKFMSILWTDPTGLKLVGGALFLMFLGALVMRSVIKIRV
jgi:tight adherence protein B